MARLYHCNGKNGVCLHESENGCFECDSFDNSGGYYIEDENPYWERICLLAAKQRAKGIDTYGKGIEKNPAAMLKRIEYLQEELVDGLMYCEWIKDKLAELEGELND